ncbi:MAG: hypothetical protein WA220_13205 [Candidatus Nitrosopolaris sp.]
MYWVVSFKWVGFKAVFYTFPNGTVELEQWLDDKSDNINSLGNNWHRVLQFELEVGVEELITVAEPQPV